MATKEMSDPAIKTDIESNKATYRRFINEVFNQGRLDMVDELVDESYTLHDAPPGTPEGPEAIKQVVKMFRAAFPDLQITIEDQIAEGDKVCSLAVTRGTHKGTIFGIAPTGNSIAMKGLTLVTIIDGKLVETWIKNDMMGLMEQLKGKN
jgi:predicted ester cyclase